MIDWSKWRKGKNGEHYTMTLDRIIQRPIIVGGLGMIPCYFIHSVWALVLVWDAVSVFVFVQLCRFTKFYTFRRLRYIALDSFFATIIISELFIKEGGGVMQLAGIVLLFSFLFYVMTALVINEISELESHGIISVNKEDEI